MTTHNSAGLNPTTAVANKWIAYVPLKPVLGDAFPNLELQLTQTYIPPMVVSSGTVAIQGYKIKIPIGGIVNADDKTLKFQYIIDSTWSNYIALHTWASKFAQIGNTIDKNSTVAQLADVTNKLNTIRLWLLSPFKKRIVDFEFYNCWIQEFGEILIDCASSNPITHNFSIAYSDFKINTIE